MILIFFNLLVITIHLLSAKLGIHLALTTTNAVHNPTVYLYGDFVHVSYYHLITNLLAFNIIYVLFPVENSWNNLKFGLKVLSVYLIINILINIFELSSYNPHHISSYYGISGATYSLYFICAAFWYTHQKIIGILMYIGGILFAFFYSNLVQLLGIDFPEFGRIAKEAHIIGILLSAYGYLALTKIFKQPT